MPFSDQLAKDIVLKRPRAKGPGYFGALPAANNIVSTEISIGVDDMEIPTLVPTLTREEINYLLAGNKPTKSIVDKAIAHAAIRAGQERDPFAQRGSLEWPLPPYLEK